MVPARGLSRVSAAAIQSVAVSVIRRGASKNPKSGSRKRLVNFPYADFWDFTKLSELPSTYRLPTMAISRQARMRGY